MTTGFYTPAKKISLTSFYIGWSAESIVASQQDSKIEKQLRFNA
jgi:hypothetical protein